MLDTGLPPSAIEQARLELTLAADATERANRPRLFFYLAILLLVVAVIYALTGVSALRSSLASVSTARKTSDDTIKLVNQVKTLQETLAKRGLDPNPRIAGKLESLADLSGATRAGPITDTAGNVTGQAGMNQRRYTAKFTNQEPAALLQFLNVALEDPETAGVEISNLSLLPGAPDPATNQVHWNLDVEFTRWERQNRR